MVIQLMQVFTYGHDGWGCQQIDTANPSWEAMESAVRRLDKFRYPFIWFYRSAQPKEASLPDIDIMGGDGAFVFSATLPNGKHSVIRFGPKSANRVEVWLSDQGAEMEEGLTCDDIDVVLALLKEFAETGTFSPDVKWE